MPKLTVTKEELAVLRTALKKSLGKDNPSLPMKDLMANVEDLAMQHLPKKALREPDDFEIDIHWLKRMFYDGKTLLEISEVLKVTSLKLLDYLDSKGIDHWKMRKHYRGLKTLVMIRKSKALTVVDLAVELGVTRQCIDGKITGLDLKEEVKGIFRRRKAAQSTPVPDSPAIVVIPKNGKEYLHYPVNLRTYLKGRGLGLEDVKVYKWLTESDDHRREWYIARFTNPGYLLHNEDENHFPGVNYHPNEYFLAKVGSKTSLGYYKSFKAAKDAIEKFIMEGEVKSVRPRKAGASFNIQEFKDLFYQGHSLKEMGALLGMSEATVFKYVKIHGLLRRRSRNRAQRKSYAS